MKKPHEICERMKISQRQLEKLVSRGELLVLTGGIETKSRFPRWQLDKKGKPRPRLKATLERVGNGWEAYRFFNWIYRDKSCRKLLIEKNFKELEYCIKAWTSDNYL